MYKSVSAFAPIANPINCPWGQKAFKGYFGEDQQQKWKEHDATELVKQWKGPLEMLIDVVCFFCRSRIHSKLLTLATISTSKSNSSPRTSSTQPRRLVMTRASISACSLITTTATTSWRRLPTTMSSGRRSTSARSKSIQRRFRSMARVLIATEAARNLDISYRRGLGKLVVMPWKSLYASYQFLKIYNLT
jgi:hypothetical protein